MSGDVRVGEQDMLREATAGMSNGANMARALAAAADDGSVGSIAAHLLGVRGGANALVRVPLMWRDLEVPPHATPHLTQHELALLRCPDGKVAHVHRFRVVDGETLAADLSALALQRAARESYGGPGRLLDRGWHSSVDLFSWRGEAASEGLSRAAAAAAVAAFTAVADDDGVDGVDASTAVVDARSAPSTTGDRLVAGDDADETATRRTKQKRDPLRGPAAADPQARVVIRKDLTRSWFNVWPPGSGHPAHDHADASIAGVFYAQVPKLPDAEGARTRRDRAPAATAAAAAAASCTGKQSEAAAASCTGKQSEAAAADDEGVHSAALVLSTAPPTSKRLGSGAAAAEVTEYAAVGPEPGTIVMFPGWLYHGVLPLLLPPEASGKVLEEPRSPGDGFDAGLAKTVRISAAFNVVFQGHEPAGPKEDDVSC